jgi:hypothetical protein
MNTLSYILAGVALMAGAVIYGIDVFCAIVQRPALAHVNDRALTSVMGRVHEYGDRRLPLPAGNTNKTALSGTRRHDR